MKKEIVQQNNRVVYHRYGQGLPVVLVHGFGEDHRVFEQQVNYLKNSYLVLTPDLPGSGASELPPSEVSMEMLAETLEDIRKAEQLDKFVLIGHSMGGYITMAYAEKYPQRLLGYGLFHSTSAADDDEKKKTRQKAIEFIRTHGSAKFLAEAIPKLFSEESRSSQPQLIEEMISRYSDFDPGALIAYYEAMMKRPDRSEFLKKARVPVLFIAGQFDETIPLENMLKLVSLPEFSYIHICNHSGHMGMLEEPAFCNRTIEKYLSEI